MVYAFGRIALMRRKKSYSPLAYVEFVVALLLLIGLYTQGALIAVIILTFVELRLDSKSMTPNPTEKIFSICIAIVAFALLFLGPGAFALDYPL